MINCEFYKDKLQQLASEGRAIGVHNGEPIYCNEIGCYECDLNVRKCSKDLVRWLCQEHEPYVDWSKVEVDTPILASHDGEHWERRHFAKYENGKVYVFISGTTSWSNETNHIVTWKHAKLKEN